MKILASLIALGVSALALIGIASADSVKLFSLVGSTNNLNGYTTADGATFTQVYGPTIAVYSGTLSWSATLNDPAKFVVSKAGVPVAPSSGTLSTTAARVTAANGSINLKFGLGDTLVLKDFGPVYCGEAFAKDNPYDNAYVVRFSPAVSTLEMNGRLLKTCLTSRTGEPTQFSIDGGGGLNGVGSVANLTLYGENAPVIEPTPTPEPTPIVVEPTPIPDPTPTPTPIPEPTPTPVDQELADALKRLDKVEQVVEYQSDLLAQANDAIRNNTTGNFDLRLDLYSLAEEQAAIDAAQAVKDAAQDEEIGWLRGMVNNIQSFIESLPFFGKDKSK
jgi:hypothetical protein